MRTWICSALVVAAALAAAPAPAQQFDDPEGRINERYLAPRSSTTVDELVVEAGQPAWWTVSFGEARVHVLGVPRAFPEDLSWRQARLESYLDETNMVLLPPVIEQRGYRGVGTLPDVGPIPADLLPRIEAAASRLGYPARRYTSLHPILAGPKLANDFRLSLGLKEEKVMIDVVTALRRDSGRMDVRISARLDAPAAQNSYAGLTVGGARACLEAVLQEVEAGDATARNAAKAWRNGQVREALQAPRSLDICDLVAPSSGLVRRATIRANGDAIAALLRDTSAAIRRERNSNRPLSVQDRRLRGQNEVVVVAYIRPLLAQDGILDQLSKAGFTVENGAPAGPVAENR